MTGLSWDEIAGRFAAARNWWVVSSGTGGPHAVPVWGVVVDAALCFYGDPTSVRSRNLSADPRAVLHLESGDAPLIVHGCARAAGRASERPDVVAAYHAAYTDPGDLQYLPDEPAMGDPTVFAVEPVRAMTWELDAFEGSQRRWRSRG